MWEERPERWSQVGQGVSSQNSSQNSPNNLQSYTNPNYPNLKINYDDSWKIETEKRKTSNNDDKDRLMNERLTLTKNTEFGLIYRSKEKSWPI